MLNLKALFELGVQYISTNLIKRLLGYLIYHSITHRGKDKNGKLKTKQTQNLKKPTITFFYDKNAPAQFQE
jgi:hypothetical protein